MVYAHAFTQSEPIMGYDQIRWGASVNDVRRAYNFGNNIALQQNYENNPDIAALVQENVSESIAERLFLFNKWGANDYRLYRVWVTYRNNSVTLQNLISGLTSRFGNSTDHNRVTGNCVNGTTSRDTTETFVFGQYSPELVVELIQTRCQHMLDMNTFSIIDINYLQVCYTWKTFRDRYNSRNIDF